MDGSLRPNNLLDEAPLAATCHQPDNAANVAGELWFSSRNRLLKMNLSETDTEPQILREFDEDITCIAGGTDGLVAIGFDNGRIVVERNGDSIEIPSVGRRNLKCPTALIFADGNRLIVCQGSTRVKPSEMTRDLMNLGVTGSVWSLDLNEHHHECLMDQLAFPYGVCFSSNNEEILVSECWRHRILKFHLNKDRPAKAVLKDLQGYPARIFRSVAGETMLCIFAPRNRLIEFVLKEKELRQQMIETIDPQYWIAPALKTGENFLEPLQQGSVKTMNIHKPWAPSFSYGLLVRLDGQENPVASYHSRANGKRHGITSCCEIQGRIFATSKGGDAILELTIDQ